MMNRFKISWQPQRMKTPSLTIKAIKGRLKITGGHTVNYIQDVEIRDDDMEDFMKCVNKNFIHIMEHYDESKENINTESRPERRDR